MRLNIKDWSTLLVAGLGCGGNWYYGVCFGMEEEGGLCRAEMDGEA